MASRYSFKVCDLITGAIRGTVQLTQASFERTLDQATPGKLSALMPLGGLDPVIARARLDATDPGRSTIVPVRDGVALGEWIITDRPDRANDGSPIQLEGSYITSYLDEVIPSFTGLAGDLPLGWSATEQLVIANALVAQCADPITSTTAPAGSRGIAITIPVVAGSGVLRDQTDWPGKYQSVRTMLNALAKLPGGFDWDIDVQIIGQFVVRTLTLSYPRRGIDGGATLQPVAGRPGGNTSRLSISEASNRVATQVIGLGAGVGAAQNVTRSANAALVAAYPLMQSTYSDSSVNDPAAMQELSDGAAMMARTSRVPPKVEILADANPVLGSYRCGDYFTVNAGASVNYPDGYKDKLRLTAYTIKPPAAGPETVPLTLAQIPEA